MSLCNILQINKYYTFYFQSGATATGILSEINKNNELIILKNTFNKNIYITGISNIIVIEELEDPIDINKKSNRLQEIDKETSNIVRDISDNLAKKTLEELQIEKRNIEKKIIQDKVKDHTFSGLSKKVEYGIPYIRKKPEFK